MGSQYYGGLGPMVNAVLWVHVVVFAVFVGLRLHTRISILNAAGADDYLIIVALVLQIVYTIFVTVATQYGLGQHFAEVGNPEAYSTAVMYEVFSQVAGLMVIGVGKLAVGVFLLRIVVVRVQIFIIWLFLGFTVFITLFASITVVVQCIPVQRTWNPTVPGHCWLDFSKVGLTVGSWFVVADFGFAILPWFVVWNLKMKRKEKLLVACGLSLGVIAGACGIVRTVALNGLNTAEYIYDTVPMLLWSATESTVTIMCSSIPVLRPLYVKVRYGSKGDSSTGGNNSGYKLPMYGNHSNRKYALGSEPGLDPKVVPAGTSHRTVITFNADNNASDESILRDVRVEDTNGTGGRIKRTDQVQVSYETSTKEGL
ncbi:hypothetical protein B0T24DRAFT_695633 [Lasiosphaeria ovina]|uniref:Rhodopsin domain-containing protein n=1 Tax=Lasiosphaeria ovina TaxID=92902 RepID=A0AAE0TSK9_9PEZI|nr:hypothetical protein B0T24DRAFT_695633 [Lasiosphaeria ovina]